MAAAAWKTPIGLCNPADDFNNELIILIKSGILIKAYALFFSPSQPGEPRGIPSQLGERNILPARRAGAPRGPSVPLKTLPRVAGAGARYPRSLTPPAPGARPALPRPARAPPLQCPPPLAAAAAGGAHWLEGAVTLPRRRWGGVWALRAGGGSVVVRRHRMERSAGLRQPRGAAPAMAVSAPPFIVATSSGGGAGSSAGLFRADALYSSPAESPRLTNSLVNTFLSAGGGVGAVGGGGSECKMVDLHGVKVASFLVEGQELICLPQVFDLFLKHLVGGLHTVYTKLKRLDISPVVCTVEQVRILRGLGAIQPGVNRCKLITRKDFETLYNDCTNASSRPGRPPKRSLGVAIQENARLLPHGVPGLLSPGLISPTGLTAAAMAEAMKLQKVKLLAMNSLHGIGSQNGTESENEELNSNAGGSESYWDKDKLQSPIMTGSQHSTGHSMLPGQSSLRSAHPLSPLQQNHLFTNRIDLPFMMMPHPLLPVSLPPASVAMAMNQMSHLNTITNMTAAAQMHSPLSRAEASVIKESIQDSPSPALSLEDSQRPGSHTSSHPSSSMSSSPSQLENTPDRIAMLINSREGELIDQETGTSLKKIQKEKELDLYPHHVFERRSEGEAARPQFALCRRCSSSMQCWQRGWITQWRLFTTDHGKGKEEVQIAIPIMKPTLDKVQLAGHALPPGFPAPFLFADGLSSVETLLTNIQGLLKVAVDNARVQEKQIQQEKKELKMELCRERELRESLERQLTAELQSRATIQKRLKKEKKAKRKLQEALEFESKRREQVEQSLKQATSDAGIPDMEIEHNGTQHDSAAMQENRTYIKPAIMY
ncbi:dachshund homolog 2-like isoform X2 [Prinia subflava]|uniref:dachshund homolog 2-like isoform X2 n=1 Tax=Prinia subflava TaxID=208062 RepID=UPI002FE20EF1